MTATSRLADEQNGLRQPPCDEAAERSVLGSILRLNAAMHDVLPILAADDFYKDAHQRIFYTMAGMLDRGKAVDAVTLAQELLALKLVEDIGGYAYIGKLLACAPTAGNVVYYAEIVREKSVARRLIHASCDIQRDAYDQGRPADELLESAERSIFAIAEATVTAGTSTLDQHTREVFDRIDGRIIERYLPSGLHALDAMIDGFKAGQLAIIAARPSHGKTSLAACLAVHFLKLEAPALFVSLEESAVSLAQRMLSCVSGVPLTRIAHRRLLDEDMQKLIVADGSLPTHLLHVADSSGQTVQRVAANARRLKRRHGIQAVILDYVQLLTPVSRKSPRHEQVAEMSRALKVMARDLEIPVIALAQLNRGPEDRPDHRPRMADLRESGALEADADMGLLLHRPEMYDLNDRPGEIDIIVDKQRLGPRGTASLRYVADCMRLEGLHRGSEFEHAI